LFPACWMFMFAGTGGRWPLSIAIAMAMASVACPIIAAKNMTIHKAFSVFRVILYFLALQIGRHWILDRPRLVAAAMLQRIFYGEEHAGERRVASLASRRNLHCCEKLASWSGEWKHAPCRCSRLPPAIVSASPHRCQRPFRSRAPHSYGSWSGQVATMVHFWFACCVFDTVQDSLSKSLTTSSTSSASMSGNVRVIDMVVLSGSTSCRYSAF